MGYASVKIVLGDKNQMKNTGKQNSGRMNTER